MSETKEVSLHSFLVRETVTADNARPSTNATISQHFTNILQHSKSYNKKPVLECEHVVKAAYLNFKRN